MTNDYFDSADYTAPTKNTLARASVVTAIAEAVENGFDLLPSEDNIKKGKVNYAVDSGGANAYIVAMPHAPAAYGDGLKVDMKVSVTNTGPSTLDVDGLGAVAIKRHDGTDTEANDLVAGSVVPLRHNGTIFRIIGPTSSDASSASASAVAAAASAVDSADAKTLAQTAQTNAETAQTNAETAETNAETAETNAAASAVTAANAARVFMDYPFNAGFDSTMVKENVTVATYGETVMSRSGSFDGESGYIQTAPTDADCIVDIEKNGTTIYATKPQFAAGANTLTAGVLKTDGTEDYVAGDRITFKVTQIGSTEAGEGLTFVVTGDSA